MIFLPYTNLLNDHILSYLADISSVSMKIPDSTKQLEKKHVASEGQVQEDSEYVRLVIPDEPRKSDADALQSQALARKRSLLWWIKAIIWCLISIIILLCFVKWGIPFLVQKVLQFHHISYWCKSFFLLFLLLKFDLKLSLFRLVFFHYKVYSTYFDMLRALYLVKS